MMEHAEHSPAAIREKAAGAVNCQSVTLPSGLTVLCRTMPGYSSVHAMYATNFGSVVREFTLNGKRIQLPAGTAHFLEHKMLNPSRAMRSTCMPKLALRQTLLPAMTAPAIFLPQPA